MADKKKQLVWNFIDFLKTSQQDGTVKEDDKESLDVASKLKHEFSLLSTSTSSDLYRAPCAQYNASPRPSRSTRNPPTTPVNTASSRRAYNPSLKSLSRP
jgi:hypothetical protein